MDKLKNITDLNFGGNLLTALPPMLSNLVTLKKFDVSKNEIRTLGSEVKFLTNLEMLALSYNVFQALPEELEYCVKVHRLYVLVQEYLLTSTKGQVLTGKGCEELEYCVQVHRLCWYKSTC
jgi:hypothetical protein